jgi:membrane-associated phospholipid phosphatase
VTLPKSYGYQPADLLVMAYAAFCVVALIIGGDQVPDGPAWLAGISGFLLLAYLVRFVPPRGPWLVRFLRDSYALWALPGAYASAGVVNRAFTLRYFDDIVLRWEAALFGGHPHVTFATQIPSVALSEFLHFCYFIYLWLLPILGFSLVLRGKNREFRTTTTTVGMTFYACFAFFIVFPVLGPYYTFEHVVAPGSFFIQLVHRTLESGAALGTAFPSSHCAVATAVTASAWRYAWRPLAVGITIIATGIVFGTMYGGFHYAIDSVAGVGVGIIFALIGPRIHRALSRVGGWGEPPPGLE